MKLSTLGKLSIASVLVSTALSANAGISVENEKGVFAISGDVEFNINYRDQNKADTQQLNQDGRVLLQVAAERSLTDDRYVGVQVQPLLHTSGSVDLDDAWVAFGQKNNWELKVGRYEAYDLFPVAQDTMLDFTGDGESVTANNETHTFNVYRVKKSRGRGDNGQVSFSKTYDRVYFEVSSLFKKLDTTTTPNANRNAVFIRPVVEFSVTDALKIAGGLDVNLTADSDDADNDFLGYGTTIKYTTDDLNVNLSYAYRDFDSIDREDSSVGATMVYKGLGLGYIYAQNDWGTTTTKSNTTNISYQIANVMDVEDLSVYLGSYFSKIDNSENKDLGTRVRIKYYF